MNIKFDADAYLKIYPDVNESLQSGEFDSALAHFIHVGAREGRFSSFQELTDQIASYLHELKRQNNNHSREIEELKSEIREKNELLHICEKNIESSNSEIERLKLLAEQAHMQNHHHSMMMSQALDNVLRSRSWTWTGPLRQVLGLGIQAQRFMVGKAVMIPDFLRWLQYQRDARRRSAIAIISKNSLFDKDYYLQKYPDVRRSGMDPAKHYFVHGWREGRDPSEVFNTAAYLRGNPDVLKSNMNPLLHYICHGAVENRSLVHDETLISSSTLLLSDSGSSSSERMRYVSIDEEVRAVVHSGFFKSKHPINVSYSEIKAESTLGKEAIDAVCRDIAKSGFFDAGYYAAMYPDIAAEKSDLLRDYCEVGWREGRNPSDEFDTRFYLETYKDISDASLNPLWHYALAGASESRNAISNKSASYEKDIYFGEIETDIQLIAFWRNPNWDVVKKRRTLFKGHAQPKIPHIDIGHYDAVDSKALLRQADTAMGHGIKAFCFAYPGHAESNEMPSFKAFLSFSEIKLSFCLQVECMGLKSGSEIPSDLMTAMSDPRYLKVDGRHVVVIASGESDYSYVSLISLEMERLFGKPPFLIANPEVTGRLDDSLKIDMFSASISSPAIKNLAKIKGFRKIGDADATVVPYSVVASRGMDQISMDSNDGLPSYPLVSLDRDSLGFRLGLICSGFSLEKYREWLDSAINRVRTHYAKDRRFVFIDAWNDWSEGLYLEPDSSSGYSRLNETSRALTGIRCGLHFPKVSVIVPNFNHEKYLVQRLESIYRQTYKNIEVLLLDDCSSDDSRRILRDYADKNHLNTRIIFNEENSGGVFKQWSKGIQQANGELIWIAESDDYCNEVFLENLVKQFNDEAVQLAYAKTIFVDLEGHTIPNEFEHYVSDLHEPERWTSSYVETAHNEVGRALGIKNTIPNASGVVFRRPDDMRLLEDDNWLSMRVAGDWVFYLHIIRGGKIAYAVEAENFFRRYVGSTAERSYRSETFYRELSTACRTVQELYDVPVSVLDKCQQYCKNLYSLFVGNDENQFLEWFDRESLENARKTRLPNILICTMGFYPGGAEILPIRLANEFKRQGASVLLLSSDLNPREDGVRRMLRNDVPLIETSEIDAVRKLIADFGIEVLNTHQWHIQKYPASVPDVFVGLSAHIASLHGMIEHGSAFGVTKEQLAVADENVSTWVYTADKNIVPFRDADLLDWKSGRFLKMPNGIQPPLVRPVPREKMGIPENAFVLCCVSRAIPDKGWAETIDAVALARELSGLDIFLVLVGNGPIYDDYCRTGVPDFVHLVGFSEDAVGYYAAADMGIMLTKFKSESFPLTIVDCLFAGRPYISSDVGDIRNMLTEGGAQAGAVIALDNWEIPIKAAASVIVEFAQNRNIYTEALELVPELAKRYRIDNVASQYIELFVRDCAKGRSGINELTLAKRIETFAV